jgi:hypothetical protein
MREYALKGGRIIKKYEGWKIERPWAALGSSKCIVDHQGYCVWAVSPDY